MNHNFRVARHSRAISPRCQGNGRSDDHFPAGGYRGVSRRPSDGNRACYVGVENDDEALQRFCPNRACIAHESQERAERSEVFLPEVQVQSDTRNT